MIMVMNIAKRWEKDLYFSLVRISWSEGNLYKGYAHLYPWTGTVDGLFKGTPLSLSNFNIQETLKDLFKT